MKRSAAIKAFVLLLVIVGGVLFLGCSKSGDSSNSKGGQGSELRSEGKMAPDFELTALDGKTVKLSELKGQVVLLDFWATWCPPCKASLPHLMELQTKYGDKGVTIIGMSLDNSPAELEMFLKRNPLNYTVISCPDRVKMEYRVTSIPRMFVLDRQGQIVADFLGFSEQVGGDIEKAVKAALSR